jgi:hypothetical protein
MSTVTTSSYAEAVGRWLDDLPAATAAELLEGLGEHLAEIGADDFASLVDLLGSPDSYAAELRASAGLPPRAVFARPTPQPSPGLGDDAVRAVRPRVAVGMHHVAVAALVVIAAGVLVALYESRDFIRLEVVVLIALVAGAGIWALRWLVEKSKLPGPWTTVATVAVIGLALAAAATLGAANRRDDVFTDNYLVPTPMTTLGQAAGPPVALPDFRHLPVEQAVDAAQAMGLEPIIRGDPGGFVVNQEPLPGSLLDAESSVLLITGETTGTTGTTATLPSVTTAAG